MSATKRDLLEAEVMRISNPRGGTVEVEDISNNVVVVKVLPIPHEQFLNAVNMVGNIIRAGKSISQDIGTVGELINEATVGSVGTELDPEGQAPIPIADKGLSIDEFIFRLVNSTTGLVEQIITDGTSLDWKIAPKKFHTMVLASLALRVLKFNYGDELKSLLADGLGLIPRMKEQDSATTE